MKYLSQAAKVESSTEVSKSDIINLLSHLGLSESSINGLLTDLIKNALIHSNDEHSLEPSYHLTLAGGYFINVLCKKMVYIESILMDTQIFDETSYDSIYDLTIEIDAENRIGDKMRLRKRRSEIFLDYLLAEERNALSKVNSVYDLSIIQNIKTDIGNEYKRAISSADRYSSASTSQRQ